MKFIDRFHKAQSSHKFPLEEVYKKNPKKSDFNKRDPSEHLLNFILKKSRIKRAFQTLKKKKKKSFFDFSPRMRSIKKNKSTSDFSKILVDKFDMTIPLAGVTNDFYSHMVDSISPSLVAFGLYDQFLLFDIRRNTFLCPMNEEHHMELTGLTSISVNPGVVNTLALGNKSGAINLVNLDKQVIFQRFNLHFLRVGSLKFHPVKPFLLASGSKDCRVVVRDLRSKNLFSSEISFEHMGEICGLSWQTRGYCLASGGNDNRIQVWDIRKKRSPLLVIDEHTAAVRALEFSPLDDNLLASGGGTGDSSIRVTSLRDQGKNSLVLKTQSQICSLLWDKQCNRLLTSHGFSKYQLCLWNLEREKLVMEYYGHTNRILDIIRMKGTNSVLSFSSDNTAKLWKPFKAPLKSRNKLFTPVKMR